MSTTIERSSAGVFSKEHRGFFGYGLEQHPTLSRETLEQRTTEIIGSLAMDGETDVSPAATAALTEAPHPTYEDQLAYLNRRFEAIPDGNGRTWLDNLHPANIWTLYLDDSCQRLED